MSAGEKMLDDDNFYDIGVQKKKNQTQMQNKVKPTSLIDEEIDPNHVMDDATSNYTQTTANGGHSSSLNKDNSSQKSQSVFGGIGFASKSKMTKKDLAAFMKEKLAQTKIASEVKT